MSITGAQGIELSFLSMDLTYVSVIALPSKS